MGFDMPVYPMSIRRPMRDDGAALDTLPDRETGHICFRGPQTFLGYVNGPAATARTLSGDGFLYTGDIGWRDAKGCAPVRKGPVGDQGRGTPGLSR